MAKDGDSPLIDADIAQLKVLLLEYKFLKLTHMETIHMFNKEEYVSPEVEVLFIALQITVLSNTEPIGGGDDPDLPWPNNNS